MLASHYYTGKIEAGCDEAGRGCLAGSVYAAAVIFPEDYHNEALNDSKQLTDHKRKQLREIIERDALAWAVGIVTAEEIDRINILNASILAMHRALDQLKVRPEAIIVDGNRFKPYQKLPHTTIVKGDGKYLSIAAASILAKTYRDDYMDGLAEEYPEYDWNSNKGYPTKKHRSYQSLRYHSLSPQEFQSAGRWAAFTRFWRIAYASRQTEPRAVVAASTYRKQEAQRTATLRKDGAIKAHALLLSRFFP